jgi:DNA-binding CsgD family transcriptional regulator
MAGSELTAADSRRRPARVLVERELEVAALTEALAAAGEGRGALVLIDGPAGIGKTMLMRAACERAGLTDGLVVTARGLALERDFAYGVVRQLFDPVRAAAGDEDWGRLFEGAAVLGRRVFDAAEVAPVEADVGHATTHGLYWLAANLAARRPLVIAVDDTHWADPPSLRWLVHLAGRLDGLRILLLVAIRSGLDSQGALYDELRTLAPGGPLRPAALSATASAAVMRERLGYEPDPNVCHACHVATGGNPFLLESLLAMLRQDEGPLTGEALPRLERLGSEPIARAVLRRVAQLPEGALELTRAVAVFGGPCRLRHGAALAGLDPEPAARLADALRAAAIFAPGVLLEFAHPIVRSSIYDALAPGERALAHARAGRLLERDHVDAERIALHLLHSEPASSPDVVEVLRAAASAAAGRGAPDAAATYLRRALEEPAGPETRPAVLLDLGLALAAVRDGGAVTVLGEAVEVTADPVEQAEAVLRSTQVLGIWGHHDAAVAVCRQALDRRDSLPPALAARLEAELTANAIVSPETAEEARRRVRDHIRDAAAESAWRINAAMGATVEGAPAGEALEQLSPVLAQGGAAVAPDSLAAAYVLLILTWNDELGLAATICDAVMGSARERGSLSMVAHAAAARSMIARRCGDLGAALTDGRISLDFKLATSPPLAVAWAAGFTVEALVELGRLDEADSVAAAAMRREPPAGHIHTLLLKQARGALRCAQGRHGEALQDLRAVATGWERLGVRHPDVASWRTPAVAACAALDRPEEAARLAVEQLELARRLGTPRTVGAALRVRAGTAGTGRAGELLAEAVVLLEQTPARVELARALADQGALLRRAGRRSEARGPLLLALELADRAGAAPLAERARVELLAAGARPRRTALTGPDALTTAERRTAELASQGLTNRQIAQRQFITQPTVETHLRHVFQKLEIGSRNQIAHALRPAPTQAPGA